MNTTEKVKQIVDKKFGIDVEIITDARDNKTTRFCELTESMIMIEVIFSDSTTIMISDYTESHTKQYKNILELAQNTKYLLNKKYKIDDIEQIKTDIESIQL